MLCNANARPNSIENVTEFLFLFVFFLKQQQQQTKRTRLLTTSASVRQLRESEYTFATFFANKKQRSVNDKEQ
jgi:hypothetical protein